MKESAEEEIDRLYSIFVNSAESVISRHLNAIVSNRCLTPLCSNAFSALLQHCIDQLIIIAKTVRHNADLKVDLTYRTLSEKYDTSKQPHIAFVTDSSHQIITKFQTDRAFVQQLLEAAVKGLKTEKGDFRRMTNLLAGCVKETIEEEWLLAKTVSDAGRMERIRTMVEEEGKESRPALVQETERFGRLRDEYEDLFVVFGYQKQYVDSWEDARLESNKYKLEIAEDQLAKTINEYNLKTDREIRINVETLKYLQWQQTDAENKIAEWVDRYEQDVDELDNELFVLTSKRDSQLEKMKYLSDLYEERKKKMEAYEAIRSERRRKMEEEILREKAAEKIQAWWRGIMVRRCLGQYRKKKGKQNKTKKKK